MKNYIINLMLVHLKKIMNKFANFLRSETGRKSAPSHYANYLFDESKILYVIYKEKFLEFDTESKKIKEKRSIVYADAELLWLQTLLRMVAKVFSRFA